MEKVAMRRNMAIEIHAHESAKLQESGINVAHHAGIGPRNLGDDVAPEPLDCARLSKAVDCGWVLPRIDRTSHEDHRARHCRVTICLYQGHSREHPHERVTKLS